LIKSQSGNQNEIGNLLRKSVIEMEFRLTSESMELLIESIVDAVENTEDRDMQFEMVKTILEDNGIIEIKN
jgi:hypothetical protein